MFFVLVEILFVNMYIVTLRTNPGLIPNEFRWCIVHEQLDKTDALDAGADLAAVGPQVPLTQYVHR